MKLVKKLLVIALSTLLMVTALFGCTAAEEKDILVVSREAGSGTRDAFDTLVKNAAGDSLAKDAAGTKRDAVLETADFQSTPNGVLTKVAGNTNAIGYISLGSLSNTVKALEVNGVAASSATVLDGTYKLQRPFVIMTKKDQTLTAATADFMRYLESSSAQDIISAKLVPQEDESQVAYTAPASAITGEIIIKGSTSVDPIWIFSSPTIRLKAEQT
jgi:phosphate transport system substrate-binding protein